LELFLNAQLILALGEHHAANALIVALNGSCLLTLALCGGLLIELARAEFGQKTNLLDRALKATEGGLEGLIFFHANNRHLEFHPVKKWWQGTRKYRELKAFWQVTNPKSPNPAPPSIRDIQNPLVVLGIETSCDETGVALVRLEPRASSGSPNQAPATGTILSQALHSQIALHAAYGGVVPELASRDHIVRLAPLANQALAEASLSWSDIDLIAYTEGPGLAGALLVGASLAQGLSYACSKPIIGVHHLEGHLLSPLLEPDAEKLVFPFLALLVSGGHTQLMRVDGLGRYTMLGETIDDAAGEAFDKSAQLLGLGYPGGPEIGKWAMKGDPARFDLPRPLAKRPTLDFSFAGLKTAVLTHVQKLKALHGLDDQARADMAASVQAAIVDVLMSKTERAISETGIQQLVVAGGVGANLALRARLKQLEQMGRCQVIFPAPSLCTDNGVMIAWAGGLRALRDQRGHDAGAFTVRPRWPLSQA